MTASPITNQTRLGFALVWVLFGISLTLPAFDSDSGWKCALTVLSVLPELQSMDIGGWLYYFAFNVTNLVLLVLPILAFTPFLNRFYRATRWLVGACFLHTLSWFVIALCKGGITGLKAGYYLWLLAVGTLLASCLLRARQIATQDSTN